MNTSGSCTNHCNSNGNSNCLSYCQGNGNSSCISHCFGNSDSSCKSYCDGDGNACTANCRDTTSAIMPVSDSRRVSRAVLVGRVRPGAAATARTRSRTSRAP